SYCNLLSKVLGCVDGMERDAAIAASAKFSVITGPFPDVEYNEEVDEDLGDYLTISCDGECDKEPISSWSGELWYTCLMCANADLCQECRDKRLEYNNNNNNNNNDN